MGKREEKLRMKKEAKLQNIFAKRFEKECPKCKAVMERGLKLVKSRVGNPRHMDVYKCTKCSYEEDSMFGIDLGMPQTMTSN